MWLEEASQWYEMYCHDLEVMRSNTGRVELGVRSTSGWCYDNPRCIRIKVAKLNGMRFITHFGEHFPPPPILCLNFFSTLRAWTVMLFNENSLPRALFDSTFSHSLHYACKSCRWVCYIVAGKLAIYSATDIQPSTFYGMDTGCEIRQKQLISGCVLTSADACIDGLVVLFNDTWSQ